MYYSNINYTESISTFTQLVRNITGTYVKKNQTNIKKTCRATTQCLRTIPRTAIEYQIIRASFKKIKLNTA